MSALRMKKGKSLVIDIYVFNPDGSTYPLAAGNLLWFTAKLSDSVPDASATLRKGSPGTTLTGITIPDATKNYAYVTINPADTSGVTEGLELRYDVQLKKPDGSLWPVREGMMTIEMPITQAS